MGQKLKQKILRELLMQNSDFLRPVVWIFVTIFWTIVTFLRFWDASEAFFLCFCKKSGLCDDGRIAWWYGIEQKVGFAFACMELSTIRHLRRHFRFGFGGLRRRERGDGGVGLFFTVLGGGEVVHLFEQAREVGAVVETALHGYFSDLQVGEFEQLAGFFEAQFLDVGRGRFTGD